MDRVQVSSNIFLCVGGTSISSCHQNGISWSYLNSQSFKFFKLFCCPPC